MSASLKPYKLTGLEISSLGDVKVRRSSHIPAVSYHYARASSLQPLRHKLLGQRRLLIALLHHRLGRREAKGNPARNRVVEHGGPGRLCRRAAGDPDLHILAVPFVRWSCQLVSKGNSKLVLTCHVHAEGRETEDGTRGALACESGVAPGLVGGLETGGRRVAVDRVQLVTPTCRQLYSLPF